MKRRLYVAYGSNLNLEQMKYRCPTAKLVGTGVIENCELQFKGFPTGAFATIGQKPGASVPVGVFDIQPMDVFAKTSPSSCYFGTRHIHWVGCLVQRQLSRNT